MPYFMRSIKFKIACVVMVCFSILISFTLYYIYNKFSNFIKEQAVSNAMQVTEQMNISIDDYVRQVRQLAYSAYVNQDIYLMITSDKVNNEFLETEDKFMTYFNNITSYREDLNGLAFSLKNNMIAHNNMPEFRPFNYDFSFKKWDEIFNKSKIGDIAVLKAPIGGIEYKDSFVLMKELKEFQSRQLFGYMLYWIDISTIGKIFDNTYLKRNGEIYLIDTKGDVIYSNAKNYTEETKNLLRNRIISKEKKTEFYSKGFKQKLLVYNTSDYTGCSIAGVFELEQLIDGKSAVFRTNIFAGLVAFLLSLIVAIIISAVFAKDIGKIIKKLELVGEGNYDVDFSSNRKDEIGHIRNAISMMLAKMKDLTARELEEVKISREAIIRQKEAEFSSLQNQINPHFLYNTLDSIRMKALINKDKEVSEMIRFLAKFFRLSVNKGKEVVNVSEEIEQVKCYLEVQSFRFKERIISEFDIDDRLLNYKMVKLILQPIVENAIIHGIEPKPDGGCIKVIGRLEGDIIEFEVIDNGIGIKEEEFQKIIQRLNANEIKTGSIGIMNVSQRIRHYYGDTYGISINSKYGMGTSVFLRFPIEIGGLE
jgi:two-component system, sensor histidine kinase YesM